MSTRLRSVHLQFVVQCNNYAGHRRQHHWPVAESDAGRDNEQRVHAPTLLHHREGDHRVWSLSDWVFRRRVHRCDAASV